MEVIVAIAIMGGALAVVGNFIFMGAKSARKTRWVSEGQILCDTKMAEVSAGVISLDGANGVSVDENPNWVYSVSVQPSELLGLLTVKVTVQPAPGIAARFEPITLTRLIPDPNYEPEESLIQ